MDRPSREAYNLLLGLVSLARYLIAIMADILPFKAWRYDVAQVGALADVTAPPYDVINPAQQEQLYKKHPCNVIRLELNREEPGDSGPDDKYRRAAEFLKRWIKEGVLVQDQDEAFYVYHQTYSWEGQEHTRKGFLGRIRLEPFGSGSVFPHEQTLSGPKADRLKLLHACRMNLSPIFGLYPDPTNAVQNELEKAVGSRPPLEARDQLNVLHRIWPVTEGVVLSQVRALLADKNIFIADGHHRYETALNYRNELGIQSQENHLANFVMMACVGMGDPGLKVLPTHRLARGFPGITAEQVAQALGPNFQLERIGTGHQAAVSAWELMQLDGGQSVFGFGTTGDGVWQLARVTDSSPMNQRATGQSDAWKALGVSLLHKLAIEHLIEPATAKKAEFTYVHSLDEVRESQDARTCDLACLVAPADVSDVEEIASHLEKMPPKSTYFYPKLHTGLTFYNHD